MFRSGPEIRRSFRPSTLPTMFGLSRRNIGFRRRGEVALRARSTSQSALGQSGEASTKKMPNQALQPTALWPRGSFGTSFAPWLSGGVGPHRLHSTVSTECF